MLAWSEGTDNGRQNQKSRLVTSRQAESYLLITPITRKLVTPNLNSNQQAPDATSSFLLVGCLPQAAWPEHLKKSGRCGIAAD